MQAESYILIVPSDPQRSKGRRYTAVLTGLFLLVLCVVGISCRGSSSISTPLEGSWSDDHDQGAGGGLKFAPEEDEFDNNSTTVDFGITNDFLSDSDMEVHRFIQDNTDQFAQLNHGVKTKDMMADHYGTEDIAKELKGTTTPLFGLPASSKDAITEEATDDPAMRGLTGSGH